MTALANQNNTVSGALVEARNASPSALNSTKEKERIEVAVPADKAAVAGSILAREHFRSSAAAAPRTRPSRV